MTPREWILGLLDAVGSSPAGKSVRQCPAHDDAAPSLSIGQGVNGRVLIRCHAGCDTRAVLDALHLPMARLFTTATMPPGRYARTFCRGLEFPPLRGRGGSGTGWTAVEIAEHAYGDPTPFAWKVRERNAVGAKRLRWESLNSRGERVPGLLGRAEASLPLYRVREVRMGIAAGETIVLCESESSVDAMASAGLYGTTWAGGGSSPPLDRLTAELDGANVLLVPDHDPAGLDCAERIVGALPHARVQRGEPGEDARDVLTREGTGWFR